MAVSVICITPLIMQDFAAQTGVAMPGIVAYLAGADWPKLVSATLLLMMSYVSFIFHWRSA